MFFPKCWTIHWEENVWMPCPRNGQNSETWETGLGRFVTCCDTSTQRLGTCVWFHTDMNYAREWRFLDCCLTEWGALCEEAGGCSGHWDGIAMWESWGSGWVGWGLKGPTMPPVSWMLHWPGWVDPSVTGPRLPVTLLFTAMDPKCHSHSAQHPWHMESSMICQQYSVSLCFVAKNGDPDRLLRYGFRWRCDTSVGVRGSNKYK